MEQPRLLTAKKVWNYSSIYLTRILAKYGKVTAKNMKAGGGVADVPAETTATSVTVMMNTKAI